MDGTNVTGALRSLPSLARDVRGAPLLVASVLVVLAGFAVSGNRVALLFQYLDSFAILVLTAIGLAIVFGIMGVINLAHGEFIMVGAVGTSLAYSRLGAPTLVAMIVGVLATVAIGVIVERTVVRWTYDRLLDSMVATWGVSLVLLEGSRILFGNALPNPPNPLGALGLETVGLLGTEYSGWRLAMAGVAAVVLLAMYVLFEHTDFGMRARATIQDEETARAMGVDTERVYTITFAIGSGLAGLAGALLAPVISVGPDMGQSYLVRSFVTVVVGGPSVVLGTSLSGGLLGGLDSVITGFTDNTTMGLIGMLLAAILVMRVLPDGVTGFVADARDALANAGAAGEGGDDG